MSAEAVARRFGTLTIQVVRGDITEQETDAIVNAANSRLWMGTGVAGAIKRRGGAEIEQEAMAKGPIDPGDAVATSAGRLKSRYCIHAAAMGQDLETSADLITRATQSALAEAARLELKSIAFPALGTGVGGFPVEAAARVMFSEVLAWSRTSALPDSVVFVLFDPSTYSAFADSVSAVPAD